MKLPNISTGQAQIIIGVAGLGIALAALYYTKKQVSDTLNKFNPTNDNNVINEGVNSWFGFDNKTQSIGTWFYDKLNPEKKPKTAPPKKAVQATQTNTVGILKPVVLPKEVKKLVAPVMKSNDFRFYELNPK